MKTPYLVAAALLLGLIIGSYSAFVTSNSTSQTASARRTTTTQLTDTYRIPSDDTISSQFSRDFDSRQPVQ